MVTCPPKSAFTEGVARIRDEGHVDLRHALEFFEPEVERAAGTDARHGQAARFGARRLEQIGERVVGRRRGHDDEGRRVCQLANRLEAPQRIIAHLAQVRVDDERIGREQERVSIGRGACGCFRADNLARPRAVVDHDGHSLRSPDLLAEQASQSVGHAARRGRHDQLDCSRRLRPRAMCEGKEWERGSARAEMQPSTAGKLHGFLAHLYRPPRMFRRRVEAATPP